MTWWRNGSAFDSRSKGWGFDSLSRQHTCSRTTLWLFFVLIFELELWKSKSIYLLSYLFPFLAWLLVRERLGDSKTLFRAACTWHPNNPGFRVCLYVCQRPIPKNRVVFTFWIQIRQGATHGTSCGTYFSNPFCDSILRAKSRSDMMRTMGLDGLIKSWTYHSNPHCWSSGRILPCHGRDPGSIPGRCNA